MIEALFATVLALKVSAHTESFKIIIDDSNHRAAPDFAVDPETIQAVVTWPAGIAPSSQTQSRDIQQTLVQLTTTILAATCHVANLEATLNQLFSTEMVLDRISMIVTVGNSRQRLFKRPYTALGEWLELANTEFALELLHPIIRRMPIETPDEMVAKSVEKDQRPNGLVGNHRDLGVVSIIDVHLWDKAGWRGTAFMQAGPNSPTIFAIMFTDADAARKIFLRWRERMGDSDRNEEIYLAIIRGISLEHSAHYRILITSKSPSTGTQSSSKTYMVTSRLQTMQAESDINLSRFLTAYRRTGAFFLAPAVLKAGQPQLLSDLAILKRQLIVRVASDIGKHDPEAMALGPVLYRERFGEPGVEGDVS